MAPVDNKQAARQPYDKVLDDIAEYVSTYKIDSEEAWNTARLTLMDTIGCELAERLSYTCFLLFECTYPVFDLHCERRESFDLINVNGRYEADLFIPLCIFTTGGLEGLRFDSCKNLIGPVVEGTIVPNGARVPGTPYQLDPIRAAFNIGTMIRWLDYNGMFLSLLASTLLP